MIIAINELVCILTGKGFSDFFFFSVSISIDHGAREIIANYILLFIFCDTKSTSVLN